MIYLYKNLFVTYGSTLEQRKLTLEVIYFKQTNRYQKVLQDISKPQVRFDLKINVLYLGAKKNQCR